MATPSASRVQAESVPSGGVLAAMVQTMRPRQWVKNGFVVAALIFSRSLGNLERVEKTALAVLAFCTISSAVYIVNDLFDARSDRNHPVKRFRPIASGRLSTTLGIVLAIVLVAATVAISSLVSRNFLWIVGGYALLNIAYSAYLKRVLLLDVFVVAFGFVLRAVAGALAIDVVVSSWLIVCTLFLALFLALSKRRHELVLLSTDAGNHRATLSEYSAYFLDQCIGIVTAATVVAYALYTMSDDVRSRLPGSRLELTIPFVLFGIFRYLYLVHQKQEGGNPARTVLTDRTLTVTVVLWALTCVLLIYR